MIKNGKNIMKYYLIEVGISHHTTYLPLSNNIINDKVN